MRLLIEIFVIGALLYVGWEKPFRDWLPANISGVAKATPTPAVKLQPFARSTSTPSGAWMYDPNRRSVLDTPNARTNSPQHSPSGNGAWMWDPNHRSPLDAPRKGASPH
jgi:hypothetical protein